MEDAAGDELVGLERLAAAVEGGHDGAEAVRFQPDVDVGAGVGVGRRRAADGGVAGLQTGQVAQRRVLARQVPLAHLLHLLQDHRKQQLG